VSDSFERDQAERVHRRREQLERARADHARRRAPARFVLLVVLTIAATAAIRVTVDAFDWSQSTGNVLVSGVVVVACVVGLPVAVAGGASATSVVWKSKLLGLDGLIRRFTSWWEAERGTEPG
jgi:hypothetical protein